MSRLIYRRLDHMVLLITVIMYFDLHMAAHSVKTGPAGYPTADRDAFTHLESDISVLTRDKSLKLSTFPHVVP